MMSDASRRVAAVAYVQAARRREELRKLERYLSMQVEDAAWSGSVDAVETLRALRRSLGRVRREIAVLTAELDRCSAELDRCEGLPRPAVRLPRLLVGAGLGLAGAVLAMLAMLARGFGG